MKVKFYELNKEEKQEVIKMYIAEQNNLYDITTIEEFTEGLVRRCESCGELVVVEEFFDELPVYENYRGESYKCCKECAEEMR